MIVVSDTGPLRYLAVLGCTELLPQLFVHVHCPPAIIQECLHPQAPVALRDFIMAKPDWLAVQQPQSLDPSLLPHLDPGEVAALSLAEELLADLILMDEKKGRHYAKARGYAVAGTLTILALAARRGLLDYHSTVARLRSTTNFRVTDAVVEAAYDALS